MSKQNPTAKESEGPVRRMECHRSKAGSSKSMAAKEVTKTQAGWENASKALVKEESVSGTIPIKKRIEEVSIRGILFGQLKFS